MSSMRQRWSSIAATVMIAAFAVFSVLLIDDLHIDNLRRRQAEQLSQLEFSSIAAGELPAPGGTISNQHWPERYGASA
jgi:hypothetical protein